jgi:hypothetical protein
MTIFKGLSTNLNGYDKPLDLDFQRAIKLPDYYDTDLENFYTNPSRFFDFSSLVNRLKLYFYFKKKR